MHCKIKLDPQCTQAYAVIVTAEITPEIQDTVKLIQSPHLVVQGFRDEQLFLLPQSRLLRVYTQQQKVYAQTTEGIYLLRLRLYEAEKLLSKEMFVRISNGEIVNSRYIHHLDISLTGTIGVYLDGGIRTFTSRRYVSRIKQFFGIAKEGKK